MDIDPQTVHKAEFKSMMKERVKGTLIEKRTRAELRSLLARCCPSVLVGPNMSLPALQHAALSHGCHERASTEGVDSHAPPLKRLRTSPPTAAPSKKSRKKALTLSAIKKDIEQTIAKYNAQFLHRWCGIRRARNAKPCQATARRLPGQQR